MNLLVLLLLSIVSEARSYWQLEWSDEFDQEKLDLDKWLVYQKDEDRCDDQKIGRLNCYTNSSRNVRLINGTLALTAIYEQRLNKNFTSAWINSAKNFTNGRIDIRAALPVGNLLSPWLKLIAPEYMNHDGSRARDNYVIVFYNDQSNNVKYGANLPKQVSINVDDHLSQEPLNRFHTYSIIWNETDLVWLFDHELTNRVDLTNTNTFLNGPVILQIYLRVGGYPYRKDEISLDPVRDWKCSLLAIDYIRYYRWNYYYRPAIDVTNEQDRNVVDFCDSVMNEIRTNKLEHVSSGSMVSSLYSTGFTFNLFILLIFFEKI